MLVAREFLLGARGDSGIVLDVQSGAWNFSVIRKLYGSVGQRKVGVESPFWFRGTVASITMVVDCANLAELFVDDPTDLGFGK